MIAALLCIYFDSESIAEGVLPAGLLLREGKTQRGGVQLEFCWEKQLNTAVFLEQQRRSTGSTLDGHETSTVFCLIYLMT